MNDKESLERMIVFWKNCRERRKEQLDRHLETMHWLHSYQWPAPFDLGVCRVTQATFLEEAKVKLEHAEKMVIYFGGKLNA